MRERNTRLNRVSAVYCVKTAMRGWEGCHVKTTVKSIGQFMEFVNKIPLWHKPRMLAAFHLWHSVSIYAKIRCVLS